MPCEQGFIDKWAIIASMRTGPKDDHVFCAPPNLVAESALCSSLPGILKSYKSSREIQGISKALRHKVQALLPTLVVLLLLLQATARFIGKCL